MKTLYPAQAHARDTLIAAVEKHGAALDASETGLGKTVVACHVAAALGRPVAVVCPKIVIPSWGRELKDAGVEPLFVLNYEKIRNGSTPWLSRARKRVYKWNLPSDTVLIVDECHKCGGDGTQNSALHMAATHQGVPTIDLSATCASSPTGLRAVGYALGLHSNLDRKEGIPSYYTWLRAHGAWQDNWRKWQPGAAKHLVRIHSKIFGGDVPRGVRLTVADMPDAFKENHVIEEILDFGPSIRKFYEEAGLTPEIVEAWLETGEIPEEEHFLVAVLRARQLAELQKAPAMIEMARDLVDEGKSVAIFVNFTETLDTISRAIDECAVIRGGQTGDDREEAVRKFQSDEARVVVANIVAGGAGVSLHDVNGNHPRVSLISPSFSVVEYVQTLGRVYRNGMKTPALQKILIAADTIETSVVKALKKKTDRMTNLLDGGDGSVYRPPSMTYALHAYRYGATNGHQYPLGVAPDLDTAKALAEHHTQYRGGKYGVAVYGAADGEEIPALVHYSPSMFKEDCPAHSLEISYQEILGTQIMLAARGWSKMTADEILAEAKLYIERTDTP